MKVELEDELSKLIDEVVCHINQCVKKHWEDHKHSIESLPQCYAEITSKKWCRIVQKFGEDDSINKAYAFICLQDGETAALGKLRKGDLHKAAKWNSPAKKAYGNIYMPEFGNCITANGLVYMR